MGLYEHDGAYTINLGGQELMHSRANASERLLGELGVAHLEREVMARVLVGGLGLGFTLRSVLESVGPQTTVEVVELIPEVIVWNQTHLRGLNGALLDDPRVETREEDVTRRILEVEPHTYDTILLDVDNGPVAMVVKNNASLYSKSGLRSIRRAMKPDGRAVFWSASPDHAFDARLRAIGFQVEAVPAKRHPGAKREVCVLYVAHQGDPLS